jgi:hypothetical protein
MKPEKSYFSDYAFSDLEEQIGGFILKAGVPKHVNGYHYIKEAISIYIKEKGMIPIVKELYPAVAEKFNSTPSRVERSIRHAIEAAYKKGQSDIAKRDIFKEISLLSNYTKNFIISGMVIMESNVEKETISAEYSFSLLKFSANIEVIAPAGIA